MQKQKLWRTWVGVLNIDSTGLVQSLWKLVYMLSKHKTTICMKCFLKKWNLKNSIFFKNILLLKLTKNTVIFILSKKHFIQNVVLCFGNMYTNFHSSRTILVLSIFKTLFRPFKIFVLAYIMLISFTQKRL